VTMGEACRRAEPLLSAHVDEELDAAEERLVRGHLGVCEHCAREVEQLVVVRSLMRSMPVRRLPEELALAQEPVVPARPQHPTRALSRAGAALAVAGGLLTGAAFSLGGQPPPDTRVVSVPLDVYVADHFVHTVHRAVTMPIRLEPPQ
jgi:anti-sigma factor RsiW